MKSYDQQVTAALSTPHYMLIVWKSQINSYFSFCHLLQLPLVTKHDADPWNVTIEGSETAITSQGKKSHAVHSS